MTSPECGPGEATAEEENAAGFREQLESLESGLKEVTRHLSLGRTLRGTAGMLGLSLRGVQRRVERIRPVVDLEV